MLGEPNGRGPIATAALPRGCCWGLYKPPSVLSLGGYGRQKWEKQAGRHAQLQGIPDPGGHMTGERHEPGLGHVGTTITAGQVITVGA
jgi:hypothetical protein